MTDKNKPNDLGEWAKIIADQGKQRQAEEEKLLHNKVKKSPELTIAAAFAFTYSANISLVHLLDFCRVSMEKMNGGAGFLALVENAVQNLAEARHRLQQMHDEIDPNKD